jgi:hypothetical protein
VEGHCTILSEDWSTWRDSGRCNRSDGIRSVVKYHPLVICVHSKKTHLLRSHWLMSAISKIIYISNKFFFFLATILIINFHVISFK